MSLDLADAVTARFFAEAEQADHTRFAEPGKINWAIQYSPVKIKILVVTDGGDYAPGVGFSLGRMLRDAFNVGLPATTPLPANYPEYARFDLTLAHRASGAGTTMGYANFVFSDERLAGFHEIWFLGVGQVGSHLQEAELDAITRFMDCGGGVLAMGHHDALGRGLCGQVPRVKGMRMAWSSDPMQVCAETSVEASAEGSRQTGCDRNRWQPPHHSANLHPVLCGPRGAIAVFAGHMHENDAIAPRALCPVEFPRGVSPELIGLRRHMVGRTKGGFSVVTPREFGVVSAYDGHEGSAQVGRVLLDSTLHPGHHTHAHPGGYDRNTRSPGYQDRLSYWRNMAIWLAPQEQQLRMRLTGMVIMLLTRPMIERTLTIRGLRPELFYMIGSEAHEALARLASSSQARVWLDALLAPHRALLEKRLANIRLKRHIGQWEAYALDRLSFTTLGGAVSCLALELQKSAYRDGDAAIKVADRVMATGLRAGLQRAHKDLVTSARQFDKAASAMLKDAA